MQTVNQLHETNPLVGMKANAKSQLPASGDMAPINGSRFSNVHRSDLLAVALVVRELAPSGSIQARCAAELRRLCAHRLSTSSKIAIAVNLAACLPWLQTQPNSRIERALLSLAAQSVSVAL